MKIVKQHSHLNGYEFIIVHKNELWRELSEVIIQVDAKNCKAKRKKELFFYSDSNAIRVFATLLTNKGWLSEQNQIYFIKDRVAIAVHFGISSSVPSKLFANHLALYACDQIDVGINLLPMKNLQSQMMLGIAYYEMCLNDLISFGRRLPSMPLVIVGLEP